MSDPLENTAQGSFEVAAKASIRLLSFYVGSESFAVDVVNVKEIRKGFNLTPLPNKSEIVLGMSQLRGAVIPVFCGHALFDVPFANAIPDLSNQIIMIMEYDLPDHKPKIIGITLDGVHQVFDIEPSLIMPAPEQSAIDSVVGLLQCSEENPMTVVIDTERLIADALARAEQEVNV